MLISCQAARGLAREAAERGTFADEVVTLEGLEAFFQAHDPAKAKVKEGVYKGGGHAHCAHTGVHVGEEGGGGGAG